MDNTYFVDEEPLFERPPAHFERCGDGLPVLLLHGWGASNVLFQPIIIRLRHAFTLIAPDFPGFGSTPPPPVPWSIDDYVLWLVHLLDHLALDQVHIVGHSFGGRVAIMLASKYPERVGKLVLTGSAGVRPRRTFKYWVKVRTFKMLRWLAHASFAPALVRHWAEKSAAMRGSPDYKQAAGTVRASLVRVINEDLRTEMPHIQAPTLLLWGEEDEETPLTDGKMMEQLIPDAGLVVFSGAGHYAYLEEATQFCRIVETFLEGK